MSEEVVRTYVLQLIGEREPFPYDEPRLPDSLLREVEENINDVLSRYHVRIKEWDEEEGNA